MGFQQSSLILAITIISISFYTSSSLCERSCGAKKVPYPFGFSEDCLIRLNCKTTNTTGDGDIKIGDFHVQNITKDAILVNLPPKCNRSIESIRTLFGHNYGLSKLNGLLLQNCKHPVNGCVIPRSSFPTGTIDDCDTKADNNLSCFSLPDNSSNGIGFLSFEKVMDAHCMFVFSSFAVESVTTDQVVSLEFQRIHLDWWIYEDCKRNPDLCSKDGNCSMIQTPQGTPGFRCSCNDGFVGDGFARGESCRRVSDSGCNPSKYISGKCGGTTRIGVLVGVVVVISGLVAGALLMIGLLLLCYFVKRRSISLRNQSSAKRLLCQAAGNSSVSFYQYKEIERATNCFSEKQRLGTGAYGTVYAGKLRDYEWVAIKRIRHRDTNSIDQVMNEIKLLSSVSHPNLVRLLGCCIEETEPILIYEFMPNGTLCQHLQRERGKGLPWTIRLTIATETANAIAYLHSAMNPPIFHRDIKSSNILLDYNYRSKVADFGLSRLGMPESSHISTAPQGTPGYLDPQYHQYFHLSDKSDVYSFGVVLVEIVTGLKVVDFSRPHSEVNLAALAIDRIGRGCIDEIIDPFLDPHRDAWTLSSIHNVAELAFRCLAFHRDMRPTMTEVAEELEQIRLSAWMPNMCLASQSASSCNSLDNGSMRSFSIASATKIVSGSQRLFVQEKTADCFTPPAEEEEEEIKDNSPVSVQDYWLSEQSSPSTNSLLGNVVQ